VNVDVALKVLLFSARALYTHCAAGLCDSRRFHSFYCLLRHCAQEPV